MNESFLKSSDPMSAGMNSRRLDLLSSLIRRHISDGRYEGCQVAVARNGSLVFSRTFGSSDEITKRGPVQDDTLFVLRSITKSFTAAAIWSLVEEGRISFHDRVADHIPEFGAKGDCKHAVTIFHLLTHQAGFPHADVTKEAWADHRRMRDEVCSYQLEWTPGSRIVYHRYAAHWVLAAIIESITGTDFRDVVRERVIDPLRISNELFLGLPEEDHCRVAREHSPADRLGREIPFHTAENTAEWYLAGHPAGGGCRAANRMEVERRP